MAVVHNGIIENFQELRKELQARGVQCTSDTDSEVIAHFLGGGGDLLAAVAALRPRLQGQYAVVALSADQGDTLVAFRNGPPLVIGIGDGEMIVASDPAAVVSLTRRCVHLEDGDMAF